MDYTVAVDGSGQAAQALMGAAGVSGIPHAFIVGAQLMVAWMHCAAAGAVGWPCHTPHD